MIFQMGGTVLYTMPVSPDKDKRAKEHSAAAAIQSLGKGEGKNSRRLSEKVTRQSWLSIITLSCSMILLETLRI